MVEVLEIPNCSSPILNTTLYIVKNVLSIVRIFGPILLIIFASINIAKMVMKPEEKKVVKKIINQFVAATILFFVPLLVNVLMNILGSNYTISSCWQEATKPQSKTSHMKTAEKDEQTIIPNPEEYEKGEKKSETKTDKEDKTGTSGNNNNIPTSNGEASPAAEKMINRAMETIGSAWVPSGYIWTGDPATSQFTCSGLIDYALGRPEHSSWPESLRDEIGQENLTTDVSKLKRGDIVFYEYYGYGHDGGWGHVGIYLGDGKIIDSSTGGVQIRDVNYMNLLGGGTLV